MRPGRRCCTCAGSSPSWRFRPTTRRRSSPSATARPSSSASATTSFSWPPIRRRFSATRETSCSSATKKWRSSPAAASSSRISPARRFPRRPSGSRGTPIMAEKSGYRHFMLKEIFEQPRAAEDTLLGRVSVETGRVFLEEIAISEADLRDINKVALVACGTSWHAGTGRQVPHRAFRRAARRSRLRLGIPVSRFHRRSEIR